MLVVALLTPFGVALGAGTDWTATRIGASLLLVVVAAGTMLFREAVRRHAVTEGRAARRMEQFGAIEAVLVGLAVAGLGWLLGWRWVLGLAVLPGVVLELRFRTQGGDGGFRHVAAGVVGLSTVVPVALWLLGLPARHPSCPPRDTANEERFQRVVR